MNEDQDYGGEEPTGEEDNFGPDDPDFDLSEQHGYMWYPERRSEWPVPGWALAVISVVVVAALVLPTIFFVLRAT